MKSILLICFLISHLAFSKDENNAGKEARLKIKVQLVIASGKSGCESGFGCCTYLLIMGKPGTGRVVTAECMLEEDVLHLFILRDFISPELLSELTQSRTFNVTEEQEVPQYILDNLREAEPRFIREGNYVIQQENDYLLVKLNVK